MINLKKEMYKIFGKVKRQFIRFKYPFISHKFKCIHVKSINETIKSLINSNKSISRFGDGELKWIIGCNDNTFEKDSKLLSAKLLKVLNSNNPNLEIGLSGVFRSCKPYTIKTSRYWKVTLVEYGNEFFRCLNPQKVYYNADITRPYMLYKNKYKRRSGNTFNLLKKIWNNKNILIVEGKYSRLGVGNNLFNNVADIKRIECPATNAFESYNKILVSVVKFLKKHKDYLTLLALGPTATVLVYDLLRHGYRSLDVGHVDLEYEWFLMGAKNKVNVPTRYVNEVSNNIMAPVHNKDYKNQIIKSIK